MSTRFKTAVIIGASSGIGAELARRLAQQGTRTALVARREENLAALQREIGVERALVYPHDVTNYGEIPALFQQICRDLGGLDLIVYASGAMPRIEPTEYSFEKDLLAVEVCFLGAVAWLNCAAERFAQAGCGTIVGISSVAGDRGRRGYPAYGAAKAALTTFLESLRNRLCRLGVRVITIKPGPIATEMTEGLTGLPLMIPVEKAVEMMMQALEGGSREVYVPGIWKPIMAIIRRIPSPLFRKMKI
jgi:short-subunit dehydrogenase